MMTAPRTWTTRRISIRNPSPHITLVAIPGDLVAGILLMARSARPRTARPSQAAIPDRSLEPESTLPAVAIRVAGAHPFVFRKMVIGPVGAGLPNPGDLVRAVD